MLFQRPTDPCFVTLCYTMHFVTAGHLTSGRFLSPKFVGLFVPATTTYVTPCEQRYLFNERSCNLKEAASSNWDMCGATVFFSFLPKTWSGRQSGRVLCWVSDPTKAGHKPQTPTHPEPLRSSHQTSHRSPALRTVGRCR